MATFPGAVTARLARQGAAPDYASRPPQAWKDRLDKARSGLDKAGADGQLPIMVSNDTLWFGMGRTRDAVGDAVAHEAGLTDADCAELVRAVAESTTPARADAFRAMIDRLGSQLPDRVRVYAHRARQDAARVGVVAPPWWRLRLAARRTAAYQAGQDSPGSTPAGQG